MGKKRGVYQNDKNLVEAKSSSIKKCNFIRDDQGVVTHRKCSGCEKVYPVEAFARDNVSAAGGYQRACRSCARERMALRRSLGKVKSQSSGQKFEILKRWRENHPEKAKAHAKVSYAIRKGTLIRKKCHCGKKGEAHHQDYSKPLDVMWLCRTHHAEWHRKHDVPEVPFIDFHLYPRYPPNYDSGNHSQAVL